MTSDDRYEIKGLISKDKTWSNYKAFDRHLNREVAIKRVLPEGGYENQEEATKVMLNEAATLCSVQHPHILTVFDAGVDKDGPYIATELLSGRTIDEMIERGSLTLDDFREVAIQSQEALVAAQDLDLVHRDIKATSIMVTWLPSGRFQIKLMDFGLAKFSPRPSHQTIEHGESVFGSIFFMAPEQFERTPLDERTDMYSMGVVYYYCLAGSYPFDGETAPQIINAHMQHQVTPLEQLRPDLPLWLCQWVMWHIAWDMEERPRDARESLKLFLMNEHGPNPATNTIPNVSSGGLSARLNTNKQTSPEAEDIKSSTKPSNEESFQIFLCHASADKERVRKLYKSLKKQGYKPWLDEEDLIPGQDWALEIPRAVQSSTIVLVCLSQHSVDKVGYVQKEIKIALDSADEQPEGAIYIIPAKLEECTPPQRLSKYHWVDLFKKDGNKKLLRALDARRQKNNP